MKKRWMQFLLSVLLLTVFTGAGIAEKYPFMYQSGNGDYTAWMYYDDSLFDAPSTRYNPSLATASLSFAMASFGAAEGEDYTIKSRHASELLEKLGFTDFETNAYFRQKPGTDSLGCLFARKEIGGRTMIACGIRGSNYGAEWASNFTVGEGSDIQYYHQGFYETSNIFLESLKEYIAEKGIKGRIALWMVGYSRAGAACNVSAGRIDEALRDGVKLFGDGMELAHDDVYAYCFEAPRGVHCDDSLYAKSELFNNIFCIVNPSDAIPLVPKGISLIRYGVEVVLFDRVNDLNYDADIRKMTGFFEHFENSAKLGAYSIPEFQMTSLLGGRITDETMYRNWTQGIYLEELIPRLVFNGFAPRENYAEDVQPGMREFLRTFYEKGSPSAMLVDIGLALLREIELSASPDLLIQELLYCQSKFPRDFKHVMMKAFRSLKLDLDVDLAARTAEYVGLGIVRTVWAEADYTLLLPLLSKDNISRIAQAHRPELTLAFMRSMDPAYTKDPVGYCLDGKYFLVEIADETADVSVTLDGTEVVRFDGGVPADTSSGIPCGRHRGLRIYLPYHSAYTICSSSEMIGVQLYDPMLDGYTNCDLDARKDGESWRIDIESE